MKRQNKTKQGGWNAIVAWYHLELYVFWECVRERYYTSMNKLQCDIVIVCWHRLVLALKLFTALALHHFPPYSHHSTEQQHEQQKRKKYFQPEHCASNAKRFVSKFQHCLHELKCKTCATHNFHKVL